MRRDTISRRARYNKHAACSEPAANSQSTLHLTHFADRSLALLCLLCACHHQVLVKIDPKYFRPTEVELLIGDPTKAKEKLGWVPTTTMQMLCKEMVQADIKLVEKGDLTS